MGKGDTVLELLHADDFLTEEIDVSEGPGHQEPIVAEPTPALPAGEGHEESDVVRYQGKVVHLDIRSGQHLITAACHHHVNIGCWQSWKGLKYTLDSN